MRGLIHTMNLQKAKLMLVFISRMLERKDHLQQRKKGADGQLSHVGIDGISRQVFRPQVRLRGMPCE